MTDSDDDDVAGLNAELDADSNALRRLCLQVLGKGFDTVQIIATRCEDGKTAVVSWGEGNHFARIGSIRDRLKEMERQ
jgi:hypothetical protein